MYADFFMQNEPNSGSSRTEHRRCAHAGSWRSRPGRPSRPSSTDPWERRPVPNGNSRPVRQQASPQGRHAARPLANVGRMQVKRPENGPIWRFFRSLATWLITAQLLVQHTVKLKVAAHESQERNSRKSICHWNLRRKPSSPNFCRDRKT